MALDSRSPDHTITDITDAVGDAGDAEPGLDAGHGPDTAIPDAAIDAVNDGAVLPEALLDEIPPTYHANASGRLVFRNAGFDELAACAFPGYDTTPAERVVEAPEELRNIFTRLDSGEEIVRLRQSFEIDGAACFFRSRHFRIFRDGLPAGYAGVYTDVTLEAEAVMQSTRTEARFQDVIRSASDWVWETDTNINLTYISDRIAEVLDQPAASLRGRHLFTLGEFKSGGPRPDLATELLPFRGRIFLMADSQGRNRRIALSGVPVFDEHTGAFTGYRGTGTDITRQWEAEQQVGVARESLEESLEELRERNVQLDSALTQARSASRAKTDFLGKMSHELRTPLNAIIGFAEMSIQQVFGSLNSRYLSYFRDIHGAAYHLLTIINDILDAANIDSEKLSFSPEPIRLSKVLAEARSIVAVRAEQDQIDMSAVELSNDWIAMADPGRTRQILVNLLGNAVKFTNPGGSVGVDAHEARDDAVAFTVWDTGIGIPPEQHDQVFESFHQVDSDLLRSPTEGTGLGLSISRQLARLMGGEITLDSMPGRGARFTVRLPKAPAEDETAD